MTNDQRQLLCIQELSRAGVCARKALHAFVVPRRRLSPVVGSVLGLLISIPLTAQSHNEQAVKAALVFNLTKYIEWSQPQPNNTLVIGFFGDGSMGEVLKRQLTGKSSDSRTIQVIASPSDDDMKRCSVLYISLSSQQKTRALIDKVRGKEILTVSDTIWFARTGGMVGLITKGDQVQVQINPEAVQTGRLKVSSRLMSIATLVTAAGTNN